MKRLATASASAIALLAFGWSLGAAIAADEKAASTPATQGLLRNPTCPVSGKPTDPQHFLALNDDKAQVRARVYFCCPNCPKGVKDEAALKEAYIKAFLTKKDGTKIAYGKTALDLKNAVCPVSGDKTSAETGSINYNGAKLHICCPDCDTNFKADPDKFLGKVSAEIEKAQAEQKKVEEKKKS